MNVICSHGFRMLVSKLDEFKMDLGMNYTKKDEKGNLHSNIKDRFVLDFLKEWNGMIYKVGVLGPLSLYTYTHLPDGEIWFFKDGEKIIKKFDMNEAEFDIEKYLAKLIWDVKNDE